ncbi:MAG: hypothetical protein OQK24_08015 [Magnetovibrio sp.]|nr:hypothetical protein [Magnetovibrio sp.]
MKKVALVTLHGMGKIKPNYFGDLEKGLKKRLGDRWSQISFQNVQYAPAMQKPQDALWKDVNGEPNNDIDSSRLRKFFLYSFSDASSLEHSAQRGEGTYLAAQKAIQMKLKRAYRDLKNVNDKHVVIIAQSLGCQVISNYLWDAQKGKNIFKNTDGIAPDELKFLKLKSLKHLITTGCNIPIFVGGMTTRKCFSKPHGDFKWDNYYDPDDALGWPVRQLGKTFEIANDHDINAGGLITSWNPLSHGQYWSDRNVIKPLSNTLEGLLG